MEIGILGMGEVGQAMKEVYLKSPYQLREPFDIKENDLNKGINTFEKRMEYLHVCIPYSKLFFEIVGEIIEKYEPKIVIIHSTVEVGMTQRLFLKYGNVIHSPIRGVHPHLYKGVKEMVKYIGADDKDIANTVATHFMKDLGLEVSILQYSKTTELAKLLSTTYYGSIIAFHDYADKLCKENEIDFDSAFTNFNKSYNEGYKKLGKSNVIRPVLHSPEGKIGGHCVISNAELLKTQFGENDILNTILKLK